MQGILQHPRIAGESTSKGRLLRDPQPEWDVLIIDEPVKQLSSNSLYPQDLLRNGF